MSNIIKNPISNVDNIQCESEKQKVKTCGETSVEMLVASKQNPCSCYCKRMFSNNNVEEIGSILKDLISSRKSGKTTIKLEIELDN